MPAPEERIGRYRLVQQLGEGGMGVVHLALDPSGRAVAIKVLREHIAQDSDARSRLMREVKTLARVQDARVAAVLDADTEGPRPYIVTRYVPGLSLDRVVADDGPLRGEALLRLGRGLSDALGAIHRAGVIHRDLKPGNVLLLDGDPVVIDFGIAHVADDIRLTMTGLVMGTPGYLSPEVIQGAPVTEATDWWGWAATLAFAASGSPPFGRGPMDVVLDRVRRGDADLSGVDRQLAPLLQAALSPNAADRPHADEVVKALDRYAAGSPATLAIPFGSSSPLTQQVASSATQVIVQGSVGGRERDVSQAGEPDPQSGESDPSAGEAHRPAQQGPEPTTPESEPGRPDPRIGRPTRLGTLLALGALVLGVAAVWPVVALGLVIAWSWGARFADRSVTSLVTRRHERGRRRSDVPLAVAASPWHILIAAAMTVLTILLPAVVAIGAIFFAALGIAAATGSDPQPDRSMPLVVGGIIGLLMSWWGPGGASLRRGSRSLVRAGAPGNGTADLVVAVLLLVAAGLGAWAWYRGGQPDWWPWTLGQFPAISRLLQ